MLLIGISGHARAGKDTIARRLVDAHGFTRLALADPIRAIAGDVLPGNPTGEPYRSPEWVADWDAYKAERPSVRALLQDLGMACREYLWDHVWLDALRWDIVSARNAGCPGIVVPDVRFCSEGKAIRHMGGEVWFVKRPGVGPANGHRAEKEIDEIGLGAHVHLENHGDIPALYGVVDRTLENSGSAHDTHGAPELGGTSQEVGEP